jgi:putative transposase
MDLFSRRIVGWSMDKNMDKHLVIKALLMAVYQRQPKSEVLVHSDQGSQYGSADYLAFMKEHNLVPSMSRAGNCHDNAVAESFSATIKKRIIKRKIYSTRNDAKAEIFNFIEMFYNPKNVTHIQAVFHLLNLRKRIFLNYKLSSEIWEVHNHLKQVCC